MNKITITKKAKAGHEPEIKIFVDGEEGNFGLKTSRILTDTDSEGGIGIFSTGNVRYCRGEGYVFVEQPKLDLSLSAKEIKRQIEERVKAVISAFEEKYPEVDETSDEEDVVCNPTNSCGIPNPFEGTTYEVVTRCGSMKFDNIFDATEAAEFEYKSGYDFEIYKVKKTKVS